MEGQGIRFADTGGDNPRASGGGWFLDSQHLRTESDGAVFHERLRGTRLLVVILVPLLLVATVAAVRATGLPMRLASPLTAGVEGLAPAELQANAADELTRALAKDGGGLVFEIVQWQTIQAKVGGPLIDIPDPADRSKSLGTTDSYELGTLVERGFATPDGYWMEILAGPTAGKSAEYDAATAETRRSALVRDGQAWRNDGTGWYETPQPPGIGLDPATVALLPTLLREASGAKEAQAIAQATARSRSMTSSPVPPPPTTGETSRPRRSRACPRAAALALAYGPPPTRTMPSAG